jgi:hypothetical protein
MSKATCAIASSTTQSPNRWTSTGRMVFAQSDLTATLLSNERARLIPSPHQRRLARSSHWRK